MRAQQTTLAGVLAVAVLTSIAPASAEDNAPLIRMAAAAAVPFAKEGIHARIDRRWAITEHRQIVRSAAGGQSEGQYELTTGPGAAVTRFSYWNGDQEIRGELLERSDAAQMYDAVTRARRDPGLLEELSPGKFRYRIFPFAPGEAKRVEVRWEKLLPARGRTVEYRAPVARANTAIVVDLEGATPASITSETHEIEVDQLPRGAVRVRATAPRGAPAAFAMRYELASKAPEAFVEDDPGHDAFVALDFPPFEPGGPTLPRDITFLVDRSGSESLDALARTRAAVRDALGRLSRRDRVNVIAFDETATDLFPSPREATEDVLRDARAFAGRIRDGAGTDLAGALRHAFETQAGGADRDRLVVVISDGGSEKAEVLAIAASGRRDVRVSTLAVGEGVDADLLTRLAAARGGLADVAASPQEDLSRRLLGVLERSGHPSLQHLKLEVTGVAGVDLAAPVPTTLASGERVHVALRCRPHGVLHAHLTGDLGEGTPQLSADVDVEVAKSPNRRSWVAHDWAKTRIDALTASRAPVARDEAVEVALAHEMTSRFTAFFAIPAEEAARIKGQLADARRRKRWLTSDPADDAAGALAEPTVTAQATPMSKGGAPKVNDSVAMAPPPPAPASAGAHAEMQLSQDAAPRHGGCASCTIIQRDRGVDTWAILAAGAAVACAFARRRARRAGAAGGAK